MDIDEKDIVTLSDDNEYVVVKKVIVNGLKYYYVANVKDMFEVKYLREEGQKLVQIHDDDELKRVVEEVAKTVNFNELFNGNEE